MIHILRDPANGNEEIIETAGSCLADCQHYARAKVYVPFYPGEFQSHEEPIQGHTFVVWTRVG